MATGIPWFISAVFAMGALLYIALNWEEAQHRWAAVLVIAALAEWNLGYGGYMQSTSGDAQSAWSKAYLAGVALFPAFFLNYTLQFTHLSTQTSGRFIRTGAFALSTLFFAVFLSNDLHHWALASPVPVEGNLVERFARYGPALRVFFGYAFVVIAVAIAVLANSYGQRERLHRWQTGVLFAMILPTGIAVVIRPNLVPLAGGVAALLLVVFLPRIREASLVPHSYRIASNTIASAVLVLDSERRVLDMNSAAESLIGRSISDTRGADATTLGILAPAVWELITNEDCEGLTTAIQRDGVEQQYKVNGLVLRNWIGRKAGHVVALTNVTRSDVLSAALEERSLELHRNLDLQHTLAQTVATIGATDTRNDALTTMAVSLNKSGIGFVLLGSTSQADVTVVRFASCEPAVFGEWEYTFAGGSRRRNADRGRISPGEPAHPVRTMVTDISSSPSAMDGWAIDGQTPLFSFPVSSAESDSDLLILWGEHLEGVAEELLSLFASQVGAVLHRIDSYEAKLAANTELQRSKAFVSALSRVSAAISQPGDSGAVLAVLDNELLKLNLGSIFGRLEPDGSAITIESMSSHDATAASIGKRTGLNLVGHSISRKYWESFSEPMVARGEALFIEDPVEFTHRMIPKIPVAVLRSVLNLTRGPVPDVAVYLPLVLDGEPYGVLGIWGPDLRRDDIPALQIFATQVISALRRTKALEDEREETGRLTRANRTILALSAVAAQMTTTSETEQILAILDRELLRLGITFMLTTLDHEEASLTLRHTSIDNRLVTKLERVVGTRAIGLVLTAERFSYWGQLINEKQPVIIEDSVAATAQELGKILGSPAPSLERLLAPVFRGAGWNVISIWLPLVAQNRVLGTINFWGEALQRADVPALHVFAGQVAAALEHARLLEAQRQRAEELATALAEKTALVSESARSRQE